MNTDLDRLYSLLTPASQRTEEEGYESMPVTSSLDAMPLLPEQVDDLERLLEQDPDATCAYLARAYGRETMTVPEAREILRELREKLAAPGETAAELEGLFDRPPVPPPADFGFPGYDPVNLPIDTGRRDFEDGDGLRYILAGGLNGLRYHTGRLSLQSFRSHLDHASAFSYSLDANPNEDLRIALFADFCNGYYHALYIAKRFATTRYPYAIYLGDVYYAGKAPEMQSYLENPLAGALRNGTELFLLAGNHEMYSKGGPWLDYIDRKRTSGPGQQRQEGTYFRLEREKFQIIGIDTEWQDHGHFREQQTRAWLERVLLEGRDRGAVNILLSSSEPYEYGKANAKPLYGDLANLARDQMIDLWFWGNTHYCALFESTSTFPFIGSCIGHAGYPYKRQVQGRTTPAPLRFLETGNRFGREDIRPDRGNNGYCEMVLRRSGRIELNYIDWMGRVRHQAALDRDAAGKLQLE